MKDLNIPVGVSDFTEIRTNGYYYIDKSGLIKDILKTASTKVTLITRPRRFGKTLAMSMLDSYFDIRKDSKQLFEGLEISQNQVLCNEWMNKYPTIFVSFRQVEGLDFKGAYDMLTVVIANLFNEYIYLLDSKKATEFQKTSFKNLLSGNASVKEVKNSIYLLMNMMNDYYNEQVILLIDEYDFPVAKANNNGYYNEMLDVMKSLMQAVKDKKTLKFAIITGCLRIAKERIFTGMNNFVSDTIVSSHLNEYFGFTQKEVNKILSDADVITYADIIKEWYNGYHFGNYDIYCPWDVMNYILDLQYNPKAEPQSYWKNTSDNAIIRSFIDYSGSNITRKLEVLMSGGHIFQHIDEYLTYDYLHSDEDNIWSILYLTGYLTQVKEDVGRKLDDSKMTALTIPNKEIRDIFETTVIKWFDDSARMWNRKALFDAVWSGNSESITYEMNKLLRKTISYHDYREDFYHAFLAGIFACAGYMVDSNKEHGEGRSDVVVYDTINARVAVFEAKYTRALDKLESECDIALEQIDERMYAKEYEDDYDDILCYVISFFKKRCLVKKK